MSLEDRVELISMEEANELAQSDVDWAKRMTKYGAIAFGLFNGIGLFTDLYMNVPIYIVGASLISSSMMISSLRCRFEENPFAYIRHYHQKEIDYVELHTS